MYPEDSAVLFSAYLDATAKSHGYFVLDFSQDTNDLIRFLTNIFPDEVPPKIYTPYTYYDRPFGILVMRLIKSNYHTLKILKTARPKLLKGIISNCNKDLLNSISKCVLNVLKENIRLSDFAKRKLKKHKSNLRSFTGKRLPLTPKERIIVQRGGFLLRLLTAVSPNSASLLFRNRDK